MSRVGKAPIIIPANVQVTIDGNKLITVKGPKGELKLALLKEVLVSVNENTITVDVVEKENVKVRALWGLFRNLINNMVICLLKNVLFTGEYFTSQIVESTLYSCVTRIMYNKYIVPQSLSL